MTSTRNSAERATARQVKPTLKGGLKERPSYNWNATQQQVIFNALHCQKANS